MFLQHLLILKLHKSSGVKVQASSNSRSGSEDCSILLASDSY